jgi:hypothetical protein
MKRGLVTLLLLVGSLFALRTEACAEPIGQPISAWPLFHKKPPIVVPFPEDDADPDLLGAQLLGMLPTIRKNYPLIPASYFSAIVADLVKLNDDKTDQEIATDRTQFEGDVHSLLFQMRLADRSNYT